jgi:AAHS family 4-hydroxybenzoate transporter-like MFS transporter
MSVDTVDVDATLDRARFRGLPLIVLICSAVTLALDGFDIQLIGFVAPVLTVEFAVGRGALAPVLAASLIGMGLGGLGVGPIGDRIGRRKALLVSALLFGGCTLLASTATSLPLLTFWRLLTGIGLGGALPNATTLMVEFSPPRWRSQAVAAAIVGVPLGGMVGAEIVATLLPLLGWRAMFALGGAFPLVWFVVIYFLMPESPRYLATRPDKKRELAAILNRIEDAPLYTGQENFVLSSIANGPVSAGLGALFSRSLARDTIAAWIILSANIFAIYALLNWIPVVLTALGLDLATAVRGALVFNLNAVFGMLAISWVVSRFGSRKPLIISGAIATGSMLYLAWLAQATFANEEQNIPLAALLAGVALAGITTGSIQAGMYVVSAHIYPTECRASGVGWALGVGRLGGVFSSFAGALLLASGARETGFFLGISAAFVLASLGLAALRRHISAPYQKPISEPEIEFDFAGPALEKPQRLKKKGISK